MADTETLLQAWAERASTEDEAWAHTVPGPALDAVTARLASVPRDFLDERVSLPALFGDILPAVAAPACLAFADDARVRTAAAIALWLMAADDLVEPLDPPLNTARAGVAVDALALRVASVVDPAAWLVDDERRVEAARTFLLWDGLRPTGEDTATARALLDACDSLARDRAMAAAYEGHRHRAEIARRLQEARQREAAARYSAE
jgi:hypothetical protein